MLLDSVAVGGQAAASARIENYVGFPSGLTGIELASRALVQAHKFGAHVSSPCEVVALDSDDGHLHLRLSNGDIVDTRAVVLATGAQYGKLPLDGWSRYEGRGIFYAATDLEARACVGQTVAVVGGANSAGQAALFLAERGSNVDLVVRASDLAMGMSHYLVARVLAHGHINVQTGAEITALHGHDSLEDITVTTTGGTTGARRDCRGLFCFIGAQPATDWLRDVVLDADGFIVTDRELSTDDLCATWACSAENLSPSRQVFPMCSLLVTLAREPLLHRPDGPVVVGEDVVELVAGADTNLGEDFPQVVLDRTWTDEQPGADLRVRQTVAGELRDLGLLRGELAGRFHRAFANRLARGQQLASGAVGEPFSPHRGEHFVGHAQLPTRINPPVLAS
jgi:thioredoxin reductase